MLCAISGEVPEEPVVSKKTGTVYEKRLILKYIEEHDGHGPNAEDELDPEDLLDVKTSRVVRPRPPNFTSLPSLLKAFQDEWDALVLETYNTKEQLARTREELATALYQHDAAVRVIARVTKERDEAREALSKVTITAGAEANSGDAMQVDGEGLPEEWASHVDEVQETLKKSRKKRPVPEGWAIPEEISALQQTIVHPLDVPQVSNLEVEEGTALVTSYSGATVIYNIAEDTVQPVIELGQAAYSSLLVDGSKAIYGTENGQVHIYEKEDPLISLGEHAGPVTGLALHPGKELLASVGVDKAFVFYSLKNKSLSRVSRAYTEESLTSCAFHPDGHLFAAGTQTGDIKIYDVKTGTLAATFTLGSPIQALVFSENGFWFAASGKGQQSVTIFDLRKEGDAAKAKELETGDAQSLAWDYTGQYLATAGVQGITVQQYVKSSKKWAEPLRVGTPSVGVRWGDKARSLVSVNAGGVVSVLGVKEE